MGSNNPIGSTAMTDLFFNAGNLDKALNSSLDSWIDRFGVERKTWEGHKKEIITGALESRNGKIELKEWISIREFGVVFDDVTDNHLALNNAFTSGKRIYIPDPGNGKCAMTSKPIKWSSNTVIMGPGKHIPVIKAMASMPGELDLLCNANYMSQTLQYDRNLLAFDLCVHANGFARKKSIVGEWGRGIRWSSVFDSLLIRCRVIEGPQHCIDITNYKDNYIGIGHNGIVEGPSFNIVIADSDVQDYCYDDGITTHGSYSILIDNCTGRISDYAKSKRAYQSTQNAFEVDDGSWDVVVVDCRAYCNGTNSKGFSVATHSGNPAAFNVVFRDCTAYNAIIGYNCWADINTDATFNSINWKCRNVKFENCTLREPFVNLTDNNFPSRCLDTTGFMNVKIHDFQLYLSNPQGIQKTPISLMHVNSTAICEIKNFTIIGVGNDSLGSTVYRESAWIKIGGGSSVVSIDGVDIDNLGYCNRLITDSENGALVEVKNVRVRTIPSDGQTKTCIVSGSQRVKYENINVPSGMIPYKIGRSFTQYPIADYEFNQIGNNKVVIGGYKFQSETDAGGKQVKPGLYFENQYHSTDQTSGKGMISWKTRDDKISAFSITAHHDDTSLYVPMLSIWDTPTFSSIECPVDIKASLGRASFRFTTGYFNTNPIVTSDAREKSVPIEISDVLLDIADDIKIILFKWLASIAEKGEKNARWHFGPIAQQIRDAFVAHGEDGRDYGLLCYDEWDDVYQDVYSIRIDEKGNEIQEPTGERILITPKGDRWGVRTDQCHWLLHAAQRRTNEKIKNEIQDLKLRLERLESK